MGEWMDIHVFLISAIVKNEWSVSHSGPLNPGERVPSIIWIGGWVGPRTGVDDLDKRKISLL
jgi:hypothetical protein